MSAVRVRIAIIDPHDHLCDHERLLFCCRIFTPAQPAYLAASVRDFLYDAYTRRPDREIVLRTAFISGDRRA
jgi:hypothetical protein